MSRMFPWELIVLLRSDPWQALSVWTGGENWHWIQILRSDITIFDLLESFHQGCFLIIDETAGGRGYLGVSGCLISHISRQVCAARPGPDPDIRQKYDRPLSRPALSRHRLSSTLHCPCQARATHLLLLDHLSFEHFGQKIVFLHFSQIGLNAIFKSLSF